MKQIIRELKRQAAGEKLEPEQLEGLIRAGYVYRNDDEHLLTDQGRQALARPGVYPGAETTARMKSPGGRPINYGPWFPECRISCIQYAAAPNAMSPAAIPRNCSVNRPANRKAAPIQSNILGHRLASLNRRISSCQELLIGWACRQRKAPLSQGASQLVTNG